MICASQRETTETAGCSLKKLIPLATYLGWTTFALATLPLL